MNLCSILCFYLIKMLRFLVGFWFVGMHGAKAILLAWLVANILLVSGLLSVDLAVCRGMQGDTYLQ